MTNEAWNLRGGVIPVSDGMDYITIETMDNTSDIITAFPSFDNLN